MSKIDNPTRKGRIISMKIERRPADCGDISYLGKYSSEPGPFDRTIDRQTVGYVQPGKCRYFIAVMSASESGNPESVRQDYERAEAYCRDEWSMVGVIASAQICLPGSDIVQRITSGGLWGIESDSGEDYFAETEKAQLEELEEELFRLGFTARQIEHAETCLRNVGR